MPTTRRPRPVQPKTLAYNVAVATITLVLLTFPSSDAFGLMPLEQSTEFLALISTPAQTWLSSNLPLTAPPLSSLLSSSTLSTFTSSNGHNTASSWSSLALPADLSYVCDEDDFCVMESDDADVENHQERFIMEELLGNMPTKATLAAAAQSVISDAVATQKSGSRIIHLTAEEQQLFQLLVDFRNECCPATTIRVAGGWVRDKLLAYQQYSGNANAKNAAAGQTTFHASKDIDLVTSNISGQAFAYLLRGYLNKRQGLNTNPFSFVEKKQDCDLEFSFPHLTYSKVQSLITADSDGATFSAISSTTTTTHQNYANTNPLQTASFQIAGFDIDVCHLRKDQYDGSSRVPTQTQLASAAEDAWRRDLTINSLFFNLHSNQIEDWTEHGLQDLLSQRKIATPKAPLPTLLQDPLRILRAIRFAAQFSFAMDPKLIKAARNPRVQSAINAKLSQTRRAKEMDAIFRTSNPSLGIGFLLDADLLSALLPTSSSEESSTDIDNIWENGFLILLHTQRLASQVFVKWGDWKDVNRRFLWYAALLQPFYGQQLQRQAKLSRRSRSPLFDLLNSKLKLSKSDVQSIESITRGLEAVPELLYLEEEDSITRKGLYENKEIQQAQRLAYYEALVKVGPLWKETMLLHLAIGCHKRDRSMSIEKAINVFKMLQSKIRNLGLDSSSGGNYDSIFGLHPLLTGSEIMNDTLPRLLQGKLFKEVMEEQKRWQVRHLDAIASQSKEQMVLKLRDHLQKCFPDYV